MSSIFEKLTLAPADPIFSVVQAYREDTFEKKVDLSVGAYRDDGGKPVVFDCVKKAGMRVYTEPGHNKEYLGMAGDAALVALAQKMVFGEECQRLKDGKIASAQVLSGTGSLTVVGHLLRMSLGSADKAKVYVSDPTWPNHLQIYNELLGFEIAKYPYWDAQKRGANIEGMLKCLSDAPERSIVILHACAHNPTGEDPSMEEWKKIAEVVKSKKHITIMDAAYQGFASDFNKDIASVRLFEQMGIDFAVCQSFAKNMGLYGERCGALHYVCSDKDEATKVKGRIARICRQLWSNPPKHGAEIAKMVLSDPELNAQWKIELQAASERICEMRAALRNNLEKLGTPGTWTHLTKQIGMFSYTGLTEPQCKLLTEKYHIYLTKNGRISMAGVNTSNVEYVASAIDDAVRNA